MSLTTDHHKFAESETIVWYCRMLRGISAQTSLRIFAVLLYSPTGYVTAGLLTEVLGLTRSTIERHLKKLEKYRVIRQHYHPKTSFDCPSKVFSLFPPAANFLAELVEELYKQSAVLQMDNDSLETFLEENNGKVYRVRPPRTTFGGV